MILIVDDHPDTADMLKRLMARHGFEAESVCSGEAAISLAKSNKPLVIVMDEMMPGISGLEAVRKLRDDPELKDVNVVFYSASFEWRKVMEAEQLGAKGWLVKGVNRLSEVVDKVASCMPKPN